jgi:ATP-binding cassette subfamily B protein
MIWRTSRRLTLAMIVLRFVRSFTPLASLWIGKLIIDRVIAIRSDGADPSELWRLVAIEVAIVLAGELLSRTSALVESLLGDQFTNYTSIRLMEHAATLDLYLFEDPAFYDKMDRARRQTTGRIGLLAQLLSIGQDTLTLVSLGAALLVYSPFLLLLLLIAVVPSFLGETHFAGLEYSLLFKWTPQRRQLDYLRFVGASDTTAKEIQMFGLSDWLISRYRTLSERFIRENRKLSIRRSIVSTLLSFGGTLGYYGAYVMILGQAITGAVSIGSLTFLAASFARSRDLISRILMTASSVLEQALYLKDLFEFFEMTADIRSPEDAIPVPETIREGFVFENVGFRYPNSERWAVRNVSMRIGAGERIALVGENGAGKTTLTKLLGRLYDPTEGRILLEGVDLRRYDLQSLRRAIGVIFQDFVRYDFRFDENIAVGEIETVSASLDAQDEAAAEGATAGESIPSVAEGVAESVVETPAEIVVAAEKSLAASLLPRFPKGYRQMLGRRFEGGVDLSGGEWQKVALARAYMRHAHLLILDEPTAALDARAEYEVFRRFSELVAGRMAVIISHRFSTVRMADRIIVLNAGEMVQQGTHDELAAQPGIYSELFSLQAEGYK